MTLDERDYCTRCHGPVEDDHELIDGRWVCAHLAELARHYEDRRNR